MKEQIKNHLEIITLLNVILINWLLYTLVFEENGSQARDALKTSGAFLAISSPNLRVLIVSP